MRDGLLSPVLVLMWPRFIGGAKTDETEANAKLIASAPELLDALIELCGCPSVIDEATIPRAGIDSAPEQVVAVFGISVARLRKARAAIAKAKGETP